MARKPIPKVATPELPDGYRWGKDISCEELSNERIAVTPEGRPIVFIGYVDRVRRSEYFKYSVSVGDHGSESRGKCRFVSLAFGNLSFSSFLDDQRAYRILDERRVVLPHGPHGFYGVLNTTNGEIDEELTRQIFGVTQEELDEFLVIFNEVCEGVKEEKYWAMKHSRTTFSKSRDNDCDLSRALIPANFPFIAFGDTTFFRGHVSLHGFYRLMAFMCHIQRRNSDLVPFGFAKYLIDAGASLALIERMKAAFFAGWRPILDWKDAFRYDD